MDLNSFWSPHSLRKPLKRGFDDPKLIFIHMQKSIRFLIWTRCSAYFHSLSAENMISDMVSSQISV